ncbi:MAG: radical SAM protein [Candidatus Woesearchaeota archaeon]
MTRIIIDCYTDEPAGLGVPPYLGTYPRYLYGYLKSNYQDENIYYLTIDDLRLFLRYNNKTPTTKLSEKTNIKIHNLTINSPNIKEILINLSGKDEIYFILGVHVPGKYLTAVPCTLRELNLLLKGLSDKVKNFNLPKKILTGPASTKFGTRSEGGKFAEKQECFTNEFFDEVNPEIVSDYDRIAKYAIAGSEMIQQIGWPYIITEIETSRGCKKRRDGKGKNAPCSFCTEPLKHALEFRKINDIIDEVKALSKKGIKYFRLGKQSDFFLWDEKGMKTLLKTIRDECEIDVLHIDNANPVLITEEKVKLVVKYCTPGNIAALGVESFDKDVVEANNLNSTPEKALEAIRIINKYGADRGEELDKDNKSSKKGKNNKENVKYNDYNGMQKFIPGINILFGLIGENKKTHIENMKYLQQILDENLLLRRINIRQVAVFPETQIEKECGNKYLKKNKKYYWRWRNEIRQNIDNEMLKRLVPVGTILKNCIAEIYDGKTTFLRQIGTYPLIIGVKGENIKKDGKIIEGKRLELGKFYDVKVTGHMLRSIVGEVV